jgi:two-component system cell cycle sensor histidine kinase/response regulator CckA
MRLAVEKKIGLGLLALSALSVAGAAFAPLGGFWRGQLYGIALFGAVLAGWALCFLDRLVVAAALRRARRLLDGFASPCAVTNRDGTLLFANEAYRALSAGGEHGYVPEVLFGARADNAAAVMALKRAARAGETHAQGVALGESADQERWFCGRIMPLAGGMALWAFEETTRLHDLQRRLKEAEQALAQRAAERKEEHSEAETASEPASDVVVEKFDQFFNDAPLGIVFADENGKIIEVNRVFEQLVEQDNTQLRGRALVDLVTREDREELAAQITQALASGEVSASSEVRLGDPPDRVAQLYASRTVREEGEQAVVLYLIETTEQKNLELQFAQSQKMQAVGQLAGGIAHDFNNLLTAIIGFCDLLLARHQAGDSSFSDIMQIQQNANRAANLVRQLLAFSRQQTLRPKLLVVTDVLAELSNLLRRLIGENIELIMTHGRNLGAVKVDQGQLEQVIINLAVNARDAMPEGGTLTIATQNISRAQSKKLGHALMPPGDYVQITVSDTGSGIPASDLGKIFEPFYTTKKVGQGTGLGLSTVYGIIKQTGGFIFPFSEDGKGAVFKIYLPMFKPADDDQAVTEAIREPAPDLTGKGTILLVEDEDAVRMFAARALRAKGYTVLEADSGEAALGHAETHGGAIDLLITDVVMPQMDGPTLSQAMWEKCPEMKIIFISGYAEDAFRRKIDRDDLSFLPKPFSLKQLAQKVKDVMDMP